MSDPSMDSKDEVAAAEEAPQHPPVIQMQPGARLAARRQELGWTVEHVASRLNLAPRQIEAIEAGNYAALPGMASTRGFIRAYAKLLAIDPAPLVSAFAVDTAPLEESAPLRRPLPAAPFSPVRLAPMNRNGPSRTLIGLAVLLLVLVAAFSAWQAGWLDTVADGVSARPEGPAGTAATSGSTSPAPAAAVATPAAPAAPAAPVAPADIVTSPLPQVAPVVPVAPAPAATQPVLSAPEKTVVADTGAMSDQRALVVKARQDCWMEVRKSDKTVLFSRMIRAGTTERVDLSGPLIVVLGNASGVEAILRGQALDLRSGAKNNVARLELK
ncbi:helix-turn-helix domain-containing protein [Lacisediminimonas profundi]|uniref:helix-turn-helix domain-containing protein n=1 Tax=Lacisediminimonas profundi TaxID=2603856 RepID=UPI00124B2A20|nr:RodZ domain-containing protein [Lacisediminimonas profundi]